MLTWWILGCALRGGAEVDLADLAPLAPEGLQGLREEEHGLSVARTLLAGARAEQERAAARVDAARERRRQVELDRNVEKARLDAATASADPSLRGLALGRYEQARRTVDSAEAGERWQISAADTAREQTRLAEARVDLREAELEMARLELLERNDAGRGYLRSDFVEQLRDAQRAYDDAQRRYDEASEASMRAYERWRALDERVQG